MIDIRKDSNDARARSTSGATTRDVLNYRMTAAEHSLKPTSTFG